MRILYLTYQIPLPQDNGDRIYTSSLLRELTRNSHDVHLVVFDENTENFANATSCDEFPYASQLTTVPFSPKSHSRAFFSFRPGMIANRYSRPYIRAVRAILEREEPFDAILVNHFKMAYLVENIQEQVSNVPIILITQNAESPLCKTIYENHRNPIKKVAYYLDWIKMRSYEPRYLKQYHAVTGICQEDSDYFLRQYGLPNVTVLTPSIDLAEYRAKLPDSTKHRTVIVCGSFLWEPKKLNLLHLLNCEKFDLFSKNSVTLKIVGNANPMFVKHVNATYKGVHMTGWISDVREHYADCSIALIPELMGGGFKLKILEAAALKKAIVGLKGAVTAAGFEAGTHYIEAKQINDLVEKTIDLMDAPKQIELLTKNAYDLIEKEYTGDGMYTKIINIIRSLGNRDI